MNSDILVSVITVCYNSEKTITQTIESVLEQTYDKIEYIVVDGGSDDQTVDIIKKYAEASPDKIRWISEPDKGIYDAMNKGIRMATGTIVGIINSDDYYETNAVEQIVRHMQDNPYQILYGFTRALRDGKEDSIFINSPEFLKNRMISHPSCFVSKKIYDDFGTYSLKYTSVADYDFMLRMQQKKEVKFVPVYKLIANFRTGGMSSTAKAYLDLVKLQKDYGIISKREYHSIKIKSAILDCLNMAMPKGRRKNS